MASDSFVHVRVDAAEKQAAEQVLDALGLNMATTIRLLLKQIAREKRVPLSLSLTPAANTYADALEARQARANGSVGQDADQVKIQSRCIAESRDDAAGAYALSFQCECSGGQKVFSIIQRGKTANFLIPFVRGL